MIYRAIIKMWIYVEYLHTLRNVNITFSEKPSLIHSLDPVSLTCLYSCIVFLHNIKYLMSNFFG